jgi:hypothetical protein
MGLLSECYSVNYGSFYHFSILSILEEEDINYFLCHPASSPSYLLRERDGIGELE